MKKTRIVIPAMGLIAFSATAAITGTVAWFSANNVVTVGGMKVKTKVGDNLLISETNASGTFSTSLDQDVKAYLEPASTINGVDFFYHSTSEVDDTGEATDGTYIDYDEVGTTAASDTTNYGNKFSENYSVTKAEAIAFTTESNVAVAYADYVFYLKAVNAGNAAKNINLTELNLTYNGDVIAEKAWRVAVFVQDAEEYTALATAVASTDVKTILTPSGASNFDANSAVSAVDTVSALAYGAGGSITTYNQAAVIKEVASGATVYEKVTVRLWLEGEDDTCNNDTFARLTQEWDLAIEFKLGDSAVSNIQSIAAVATIGEGAAAKTGTVVLKGAVASTYQWYTSSDDQAISGATSASYSNTTASAVNVYCIAKTAAGRSYKSNVVQLAAAE